MKRPAIERKRRAGGPRTPGRTAAPARGESYHHGDLRRALLEAAERILRRDGIQGLTLRAAAREAGVSHAAPMNHFVDLSGLLSELAAIGFQRLSAAMTAGVTADATPQMRLMASGRAYVRFARDYPAMFLLMFRGERLDFTRPALAEASQAAFGVLAGAAAGSPAQERRLLTLAEAASVAASWALVHGASLLMIDGRLQALLRRLPAGTTEKELLEAMFRGRT